MNNDIRLSVEFFVLVLVLLSACNGFGFGRLKIVQTAC